MNIFQRLFKKAMGRGEAPAGGWRERRAERKRERDYLRSQKRMEKLERKEREREQRERAQRAKEEQRQKQQQRREKERQHKKGEKTFRNRWGFPKGEYDNFINFISNIPQDIVEAFGSEQLVEVFRAGENIGMNPKDLADVVMETYTENESMYAEDLLDEVYDRISDYNETVGGGYGEI